MLHLSRRRSFALTTKLEGLYCNIQANLIAKFKTVGDRLFRPVNVDLDAVNFVRLDAGGESLTGEPENTKRRMIQTGSFQRSRQRNGNFMWDFGGHLVK